jgi:fumarylacetoacetate (FAA) hydrolase family protein
MSQTTEDVTSAIGLLNQLIDGEKRTDQDRYAIARMAYAVIGNNLMPQLRARSKEANRVLAQLGQNTENENTSN